MSPRRMAQPEEELAEARGAASSGQKSRPSEPFKGRPQRAAAPLGSTAGRSRLWFGCKKPTEKRVETRVKGSG
eukprot:1035590-Prymnesium_polylepis.1